MSGIIMSAASLYSVEISESEVKGVLGSIPGGMNLAGFFACSLLGAIVSWPTLTWIGFGLASITYD